MKLHQSINYISDLYIDCKYLKSITNSDIYICGLFDKGYSGFEQYLIHEYITVNSMHIYYTYLVLLLSLMLYHKRTFMRNIIMLKIFCNE